MEIRDELSERVSELCSQMQRRNVDILSPAWWRENGFCHNLNGEIK